MTTTTDIIPVVYGTHDENTLNQLAALADYGSVEHVAIMADGHLGYSQPIGGVVAYSQHVSPSGVGFDIACGNKASRTNMTYADLAILGEARIADAIFEQVEFGIGRTTDLGTDNPLFDFEPWWTLADIAGKHEADALKSKARKQLGTVGSGNHYVDVFVECDKFGTPLGDDAPVWVGVHFGSRGFGHTIASGFLKMALGHPFAGKPPKGERYEREEPTLLDIDTDLGQAYIDLMGLAGEYAYAGRNLVVQQVLDIMGAQSMGSVHNHHNFAWYEEHHGKHMWVVRKGATPLEKGQRSFVGGSMCDLSVILRGNGTDERDSLNSTVHGAGRIMSRTKAAGRRNRRTGEVIKPGLVSEDMMRGAVREYGIHLRGGGLDESPFVYRELADVLDCHTNHNVETYLRPVIVCMAGADVYDPFKE